MEFQLILTKLTPILTSFLNETLPKICGNWWDECVVNKLSNHQRSEMEIRNFKVLESLDLAALLRIINNNWREISYIKKMPVEVRNYTNEILNIRNKYAHLGNAEPNKEDEFRDLDTIYRFISAIDKSNELIEEIKVLRDTVFPMSVRAKILKPDIEIDETKREDEKLSIIEQPIGLLVKKYIPEILNYCLNTDVLELDNLKDKDYSKKAFGINFPFLIEVKKSTEKISRYWKTVYLYENRFFVVTSEWFKWNKSLFVEYLQVKQLIQFTPAESQTITQFTASKKHTIAKSTNPLNIVEEKGKVENRIPKWFRSKSQINSRILIKYLELLGKNEFVYFSTLELNFKHLKTFQANFNQMKNFSEKNHAKVFDEINGKIYLWEPVKEFILKDYKSIQ